MSSKSRMKLPPLPVKLQYKRLYHPGFSEEAAASLLPPVPRFFRDTYKQLGLDAGREPFFLYLDGLLPRSLNHQYVHTRFNTRLLPEVKQMRNTFAEAVRLKGIRFGPSGAVASLMVFMSPRWVTKKSAILQSDVDNRVKGVHDALQHALGLRDEQVWHSLALKLVSNRQATLVWLFDLGELVSRTEFV